MRSVFFYLAVMVAVGASANAYDWTTNPGDGTPENPYQISEPNQLIDLGQNTTFPMGSNFVLVNDLIFDPNNNPSHCFTASVIPTLRASIDGRGYSIKNFDIDAATYNNEPVGLVGTLEHGGILKNLNVQNAQITVGDSFQKVGILCGINGRYIHNCQVSGTIICGTGSQRIGGLCGSNGDDTSYYGDITHCHADVSISSSSATGAIGESGGICGYSNGTIAHCSAGGTISAWAVGAGGLCGYQDSGRIISSWSSVNISAQRNMSMSGGLCGQNRYGTISHSYATGNMISAGTAYYGYETIYYVGGFCGHNSAGTIEVCYCTGNIACGPVELGQGEESGGFCGYNSSTSEIRNCFSTGDIICGPIAEDAPYRERWLGGFCGSNYGTITHSYSTGTIDTDATEKAGFCYYSGNQTNCFWDTTTSGITTGLVCGVNLTGVTGKTTTEMQDVNTFLGAGWDFVDEDANGDEDVWAISPNQYPTIYRESYSGGNGSPQSPFQIGTADDLVNLGKHRENYYDYFVLTNDLDLSSYVFDNALIAPDTGTTAFMFHGNQFNGYFNGRGHTVDHLTIQSDAVGKEYVGLFGAIGAFAEIKKIGLSNVLIAGDDMVNIGGICGQNKGTIQQCSISGSIQGKSVVGGICGENSGTITNCYSSGVISSPGVCGGICGAVGISGWGRLEKCYSNASIQSDSIYRGGLAGAVFNSSQLFNCFWDITTSGLSSGYYLFPQFWGIIENVEGYTTSQMKQQANFIGWDFVGESANGSNEIWRMCADGVDTPRLSWEFAKSGDFACADGVDLGDLEALAECWLLSEAITPAAFSYACDGNGDGVIDLADFAVLSENWPQD